MEISPPHPGFLKGKSLRVIISRPWVYICQADIHISTPQVEPSSCDGSFNLKIMSWQKSLTIPWYDITKFPDNSLTWVKWPKFLDIFSKLSDFSLTWRNFVFPWHFSDTWQPCNITTNTETNTFQYKSLYIMSRQMTSDFYHYFPSSQDFINDTCTAKISTFNCFLLGTTIPKRVVMAVFWHCLILLLTIPNYMKTASAAECDADLMDLLQTLQVFTMCYLLITLILFIG